MPTGVNETNGTGNGCDSARTMDFSRRRVGAPSARSCVSWDDSPMPHLWEIQNCDSTRDRVFAATVTHNGVVAHRVSITDSGISVQ
jgi:hypothetical protein